MFQTKTNLGGKYLSIVQINITYKFGIKQKLNQTKIKPNKINLFLVDINFIEHTIKVN